MWTLDADKHARQVAREHSAPRIIESHPVAFPQSRAMLQETCSEFRVRYAETDQMGVVYHANYLIWCEVGRTDFIRQHGRSYANLERAGLRLAVSEATLRFLGPAHYDELVRVFTCLTRLGSRAMTFAYRIVGDDPDRVLVSATTSLVSLSAEGRPAALPEEVRRTLSAALVPSRESAR